MGVDALIAQRAYDSASKHEDTPLVEKKSDEKSFLGTCVSDVYTCETTSR